VGIFASLPSPMRRNPAEVGAIEFIRVGGRPGIPDVPMTSYPRGRIDVGFTIGTRQGGGRFWGSVFCRFLLRGHAHCYQVSRVVPLTLMFWYRFTHSSLFLALNSTRDREDGMRKLSACTSAVGMDVRRLTER
jgi:hypothetical protein